MVDTNSCELTALLSELTAEPLEQMKARMFAAWENATRPFGHRLVIFGAGHLGRFVLPGLMEAGVRPLAYSDNNPRMWGTDIDGIPVLPPAEPIAGYRGEAVFLAAIYTADAVGRQLG